MKHLILIIILIFAAQKPIVKAPKLPPKPKVPLIFMQSPETPTSIKITFAAIYDYMIQNEKDKKQLKAEISNLKTDLMLLRRAIK